MPPDGASGAISTACSRTVPPTICARRRAKGYRLVSASGAFVDAVGQAKRGLSMQSENLNRQADRQAVGIETLTARLPDLSGAELDGTLAQITGFEGERDRLRGQAAALDALITADSDAQLDLTNRMASFFVAVNGGMLKLTKVSATTALATPLVPIDGTDIAAAGAWSLRIMERAEIGRPVKDRQIAIIEMLEAEGRIKEVANWKFFSLSDSTQPEIAGIKGALVGSLWTMLVTFSLAFPIGVMAAIYLEEFAPKNCSGCWGWRCSSTSSACRAPRPWRGDWCWR